MVHITLTNVQGSIFLISFILSTLQAGVAMQRLLYLLMFMSLSVSCEQINSRDIV